MDHIRDLTPDPVNRRQHTPRNLGLVVEALQTVGAARSIVIDEAGMVLAGNGVLEAAAEAGIERLRVVDADGETLVAVRRTGLSDEQKRRLAMYDNRSAELALWNVEQLKLDDAAGLDLQPFFTDAERAKLFGPDAPETFAVIDEHLETSYRCPSCGYEWSGRAKPDGPPSASEPETP
ncbi:MAG TPA: hypothetical protein VIX63_16495 [Vicinamibacterales bacterium]